MALIRMCVVPNCSQRLSWPILWIVAVCATYVWTHTTDGCVFNGSLNLLSASHPRHPHPLICAICDIKVAVKKVAQNPAMLASLQE